MNEIGAFLQCYKNPLATYKCLESFRKYYPNSTIVLLSDNGYNYTEMASLFNCIYIHSTENIPFINNNVDNGLSWGHKLIHRLMNAFNLIKEEYIMWLEDDVSVNGLIEAQLKYDLNGYCPNSFSYYSLERLKHKYDIDLNKKYYWSGHGGSIYNKNAFIKYMSNNNIIDDILSNWSFYNFASNICQDQFISIIFHLNSGTIGSYDGHNDFNGIIQHQHKKYYNYDLPDELKYLIK